MTRKETIEQLENCKDLIAQDEKEWLGEMDIPFETSTDTPTDIPINQKQITGKLKNPSDSLLKADSDECKEQKSKLDLISRQEVLGYIDRLTNSGLGKAKSLEYIKKYVERMESSERESGEWTIRNCPKCGRFVLKNWIACPYCGDLMRPKEGDTDV